MRSSSKTSTSSSAEERARRTRRVPLRHRIPVRLRHHWRFATTVTVGLVALAVIFGSSMVRPFITSSIASTETITNNIEGEGDLFDGGEHTIEITFNQAEYEDMIRTFQEEGEKQYIQADIVIDGTYIADVGLRLKGNSTLSSLRGTDSGMPEGEGDVPEGAGGEGFQDQVGGMGGFSLTQLSEDEPESLPWLISFEEFQEGRAYQGHTEIALRPAAGGSDAALNEALALELTAESGQTTQDYAFSSVTVNGGDPVARLVIDSPDAAWADSLGDGVLYKARAGGSFEYKGEDPTDYEESFNQINGENTADLQPVMDLLRFVEEADDEEFASELDDHLDTAAFAEYLATQELISNSDAMDGAGNNYYLWYDTEQQRFTVLSWDLNLSFSAMGIGGGMFDGGDGMPEMPEGEDMPEMPEGMPEDLGEGGGMGAQVGGSGTLKERFLENEEFLALYQEAYAQLYADLVDSGFAADALEELTARAEAAGDSEAATASESLSEQLASLSAEAPDPSSSGMPGR